VKFESVNTDSFVFRLHYKVAFLFMCVSGLVFAIFWIPNGKGSLICDTTDETRIAFETIECAREATFVLMRSSNTTGILFPQNERRLVNLYGVSKSSMNLPRRYQRYYQVGRLVLYFFFIYIYIVFFI